MRILCVDDDRTFLTLFERTLKKHSLPDDEIICVDTGEQGRNVLESKQVDLLLTDLMLPGISGLDVLAAAKKQNTRTEVIVITGQGSVDSAVEAMKLGARDYLQKPLNTALLTEKIDTMRELIVHRREVEDYRFAKEAIEESALKSVAELESRLDDVATLLENIKSCAQSDGGSDEKIAEILTLLQATQRKSAQ